ncbi:hypothetical protein QYF36_001704 [Acer negundo]|nr:hypothetical protein QYF36_001704 [Acer negundo]
MTFKRANQLEDVHGNRDGLRAYAVVWEDGDGVSFEREREMTFKRENLLEDVLGDKDGFGAYVVIGEDSDGVPLGRNGDSTSDT